MYLISNKSDISALPGEEDPNASSSDVRGGGQPALTGPAGQLAIEDQATTKAAQPTAAKEDLGAKQLAAMAAVEKLSASKGKNVSMAAVLFQCVKIFC